MNAMTKAGAFLLDGDYDAARRAAAAELAGDPRSAVAAVNLAASLDGLGATTEAVAAYRAAVAADPEGWQTYYVQGVHLARIGRLHEATWSLRNAVTRGGGAEANMALAAVLEAVGRLEEAIDTAVRAVGAHPDSADAHHELGRLMALAGKWDLAAMSFEEALRLTDRGVAAKWAQLGAVYYMLGRYTDADVAFGTGDRLEPGILREVAVDLWHDAQSKL